VISNSAWGNPDAVLFTGQDIVLPREVYVLSCLFSNQTGGSGKIPSPACPPSLTAPRARTRAHLAHFYIKWYISEQLVHDRDTVLTIGLTPTCGIVGSGEDILDATSILYLCNAYT
jgi:hypothetical protein